MPVTSAESARLRAVLIFLAGAVAGALVGIDAATAVTGSMRASARQHNPQYTGEGLEYVVIAVTYAGTALGGGLALLWLAVRARRVRRRRANQRS